MNKFYSLEQKDREAVLDIYGEITSMPWEAEDVTGSLAKEINHLDVDSITVHISSYGGENMVGLAIYNALLNHKATVTTICDGMACSIASVIFMAGDKRIMSEASVLMIHNCWMSISGNAEDMKKAAEALEKINNQSITAYMRGCKKSEEELRSMMDKESYLTPEEAVEWGLATEIRTESKDAGVNQSARQFVYDKIIKVAPAQLQEPTPEPTPTPEPEPEPTPEPTPAPTPEPTPEPAPEPAPVDNFLNALLKFF